MPFFSLKGHVALVTGSSTGLGKAIARVLGQAGAKVTVNYFNNQARAEKTAAEFKEAGIESILVRSDVTTEEGVDLLYRETEAKLGKPDILVINATCEQPLKPIEEYDWAFYQSMLDFFIKSPYLLTRRGLAISTAAFCVLLGLLWLLKGGPLADVTGRPTHLAAAMAPFRSPAEGGQGIESALREAEEGRFERESLIGMARQVCGT